MKFLSPLTSGSKLFYILWSNWLHTSSILLFFFFFLILKPHRRRSTASIFFLGTNTFICSSSCTVYTFDLNSVVLFFSSFFVYHRSHMETSEKQEEYVAMKKEQRQRFFQKLKKISSLDRHCKDWIILGLVDTALILKEQWDSVSLLRKQLNSRI